MSVNVGQLFIQHQNLNLMVKVGLEYLRNWQRDVFSRMSDLEKDEQGAEHFLEKRTRKITILPALNGWAMAIEHVRFLADGDLARHMSEAMGCRVIWAEVQGGALGWACFEFEKGRLVRGRLEPLAGREPRLVAAANEAGTAGLAELENPEMPLYPVDPELAAWNHLRSLGVPEEYIFVYPRDITRLTSGGDMMAGFLILKNSSRGGRNISAVGPARLARRSPGMPCRPDLVGRTNGEPVAVHEVRLLAGRPKVAALERVFAAELNWRRRALRAFAAQSPNRLPEVGFRYRVPELPDFDLEAEMDKRRAGCRSTVLRVTMSTDLLARRGFAMRAAEKLNSTHSELAARVDERGALLAKLGGEERAIDISRAYRRYLLNPQALSAVAADALADEEARLALASALTPADAARLSVVVRPAADVPADAVSAALGAELAAVAAIECSGRLVALPRAALSVLGLSEVDALAAAKGNLERAVSVVRGAPVVGVYGKLTAPEGVPVSSLVAWNGLAKCLADAVGGEAVFAAPSAGTLLYAAAGSAGDPALRAALDEEFDAAAEPVSERLLRFGIRGLEAL